MAHDDVIARMDRLNTALGRLCWMVALNLAITLACLWRLWR